MRRFANYNQMTNKRKIDETKLCKIIDDSNNKHYYSTNDIRQLEQKINRNSPKITSVETRIKEIRNDISKILTEAKAKSDYHTKTMNKQKTNKKITEETKLNEMIDELDCNNNENSNDIRQGEQRLNKKSSNVTSVETHIEELRNDILKLITAARAKSDYHKKTTNERFNTITSQNNGILIVPENRIEINTICASIAKPDTENMNTEQIEDEDNPNPTEEYGYQPSTDEVQQPIVHTLMTMPMEESQIILPPPNSITPLQQAQQEHEWRECEQRKNETFEESPTEEQTIWSEQRPHETEQDLIKHLSNQKHQDGLKIMRSRLETLFNEILNKAQKIEESIHRRKKKRKQSKYSRKETHAELDKSMTKTLHFKCLHGNTWKTHRTQRSNFKTKKKKTK